MEVPRASRKVGFKALGVLISFDNQFCCELEARIASAWRGFYKFYDILCCRSAPIKKRLSLLAMVVHPALFWCAGSWNLTQVQLAKLRKAQHAMIRKMLSPQRLEGENVPDFMRRSTTCINNIMCRHGAESRDCKYHRLQFTWAGHLARLVAYDADRLTYKTFSYKNWAWISKMSEQFNGRQQHCRKLRTWRWERPMYRFDPDWQKIARDKQQWLKALNKMVLWRSTAR